MSGFVSEALTDLFGPGDSADPKERAARSDRLFVRGLDLLTKATSDRATGHRLTALEALDAYGFDTLCAVAVDGSAIISHSTSAAGRVLRERREQLNIPIKTVASRSGLSVNIIEALENSARRPVQEYERVARVLGLDDRLISYHPTPEGNERVAVRLRTLADDHPALSPSSVASLSEAAWVAMTQIRLENQLLPSPDLPFQVSPDYGRYGRPAYAVGYDLADDVRQKLDLGSDPIPSMRELVESGLGIPIVQTQLDSRIAGATVDFESRRAIVLNISGTNSDPMVRRSTIAHELCHLLFDPYQHLESLRVDEYDELDRPAEERTDPVEQRANAFAVQLLAPQTAAIDRFQQYRGDLFVAVLNYFGLSFTAGRYQVWNGLGRSRSLNSIVSPNRKPEMDWEGREGYTLTFHPIRGLANRPSRAGRFSAIAVRSAQLGIISWNTVAEWLYCTEQEAQESRAALADLYPDVFTDGK